MTSIRETIETTLRQQGRSQYIEYAQPVIGALEQREAGMARSLVQTATGQGLSQNEVEGILRHAGMTMPEPTPAPSAGDSQMPGSGVEQTLDRIERTLSGLTEFARRYGWRG